MAAIRAVLLCGLLACIAWGQQVATAPRAASQPVAATHLPHASRPALPADGRTTAPRPDLPTEAERLHDLRVRKCSQAWEALAPWSFSEGLVEFFISEHERVGLGHYWPESMATGLSAWNLRMQVDLLGAYGPMDQRFYNGFGRGCEAVCRDLLPSGMAWQPDVLLIPRVNIRCHVEELAYWHRKTGREGYSLMRKVFLPADPDGRVATGWGSRWPKQMARIEGALAEEGF